MFPAIAIVGGSVPIAAGAALAQKMLTNQGVSVSFFGDGATNEGAWHETMNAAAVFNLPMLFVCENNLYAASTPYSKAFKIANIADRAQAYGMPGISVDGNDILAVYHAAKSAVERARNGQGSTLIECKTYRQCGHSRSDPRGYRSREEEEEWKKKDPIPRFRTCLLNENKVNEIELKEIDISVEKEFDEALVFAENSPLPDPAELFTDVFKE